MRGRRLCLPKGIEAVFIALHGEFGEDGELQAILERKGIPFTGSGSKASHAAFDKLISKKILIRYGVPTPDYEVLRRSDSISMPLPVVVKPARQGSSLGVHRVRREAEIEAALSDAFAYDRDVIVERYIPGKELTVGLVGGEPLPVVQIVAPGGCYDYRAKYTKGVCRYAVPAPLSRRTSARTQDLALCTFHALGCRGFARVDLRCSPEGDLYVLELNSIPGFTPTSLLPKAAKAAGIGFSRLCDCIMNTACCVAETGSAPGKRPGAGG